MIGGFLVTDRMLGMFKSKKKELPAANTGTKEITAKEITAKEITQ